MADRVETLRILTGTRASGRGYAAGEEPVIGNDITAEDAALLVRLGRAEVATRPAKRKTRAARGERGAA